jgi:outer membrane protein assembly factor BamB
MKRILSLALFIVFGLSVVHASAGDWPQFRCDVGRTAASPDGLPADLELVWRRILPAPQPAYPQELRLAFDTSYEPVVLDGVMFVPSMINDSVTALDASTGEQIWHFFTEGPVRFAPVAWEGKVYCISDDGYLYCLNADDGTLCWKYRGLPEGQADRKVIGHGRCVSLYPARGGPVLADGVVYFAAGIWPIEGVFVHAINAETGEAVWSNTDSDFIPRSNWDHGVGHDSGITPQGYLAIIGNKLVVPCGAQLPAFLDLDTGELHPYTMGWGGRYGLPKGCWFVAGVGNYLSHAGDLYDMSRPTEERFADTAPGRTDYKGKLYPGGFMRLDTERASQRELDEFRQPVMTPDAIYESDLSILARDIANVTLREITEADIPSHRANDSYPDTLGGHLPQLWEVISDLDVHIKAGDRLYIGGPNVVAAIDTTTSTPEIVWSQEIIGTPHRMLAANDKLFVVTKEGNILAFAAPQSGEPTTILTGERIPVPNAWAEKADDILDASGVQDGYALVLGIEDGGLISELARQSDLHIIAVDEDPAKVASVRERLDAMGLYGTRASVLVGDPTTCPFSPYFASLVVSETPDAFDESEELALTLAAFHTLRPYGGVACAWGAMADQYRIEQIVKEETLPGAVVSESGGLVLLTRSGPLPGAADWSHAEANAASTGASEDELICAPMSILWFDAAQRWHKFPGQDQVRVSSGRLILLEEGLLRASDVYTGRKLWEVEAPLGENPLTDQQARDDVRYQRHRVWGPPASLAQTTQLVVVDDAIYLSDGPDCLVFDPATGESLGRINLPEGISSSWGNIRVQGDYLIGTSGANVLCVNRHTGELLWRVETTRTALNLALGTDKVFCSELANPRVGENENEDGALFALEIATGEEVWRKAGGARLRYSAALDTIVTPTGFYRGVDGESIQLESDPPSTGFVVKGKGLPEPGMPGYIAGNKLLTGNEENLRIFDMTSGAPIGDPYHWSRRGCTGTRASVNLLTTRYRGNSAWIDLDSCEITPLLGVRPGCQINNNLYPANGVLNIPNLTAGCTCNYAPVSTACVPAEAVRRGVTE